MRKFLTLFLIITCVVCCVLGMVACTPQGLEAHKWSSEWTSNVNKHWRRCLDTGCNGRTDYEEHDWVLTATYEQATCGEVGFGQYTCSVCKATLGNENTPATIPATGNHDYELETVDVEPTCGEEGYGAYVCKVCYDYAVLPIAATGDHDYTGNYEANEQGHYHKCRNNCGVNEAIQPHTKGEGVRIEPTGTKDGRVEYRCTECNYLMEYQVIENPNVLHHFEVKFIKNGANTVTIPQLGDDGELHVTLSASANAANGYTLEYVGYTAGGNTTTVSNVTLYHYDEYTAKKSILDLSHSGGESTGYLGYVNNWFYVSQPVEDVSLLIESTPSGRAPVSVKVHVKAVWGAVTSSVDTSIPICAQTLAYYQDKKLLGISAK